MSKKMTEEDSFFSRVNYSDGCWEWQGYRQSKGYGVFHYKYNHISAHRWSYRFFTGGLNKDLLICHHCDNPSCVNPFHLFEGTVKDNTQDMLEKKRHFSQKKTACPSGHIYDLKYRGWRYCSKCRAESGVRNGKAWRAANKERIAKYKKEWRAKKTALQYQKFKER